MQQIELRCGIEDYLKMRQQNATLIKSERAELIQAFTDGINRTRPITYEKNGKNITKGKITPKEVAFKVGHIKNIGDLYYLKSICEKGNDYAKVFFGSLKVNK